MNKKVMALRLRELREHRGLKQEDLAEVLGIRQPAYSELESGHTTLTAEHVVKLAEFYGMTLDQFLQADQPILNMQDHASHGYNVIHTQNHHGVSEQAFERFTAVLEGNTAVLKSIADQQAVMIDLLTALKKP
ncbi:MAG: helix-turn-helix transcriptional regulator [Flavobacteriales bacterium]|nr:helix-turn-helix transcriptional regulator [Flavobacteriales bacterium]